MSVFRVKSDLRLFHLNISLEIIFEISPIEHNSCSFIIHSDFQKKSLRYETFSLHLTYILATSLIVRNLNQFFSLVIDANNW